MSSPAPAAAPAASPEAPAIAPPTSSSTAPAAEGGPTTVVVAEQPKRSTTDKLLGRRPTKDVEKQTSPEEDEAETKRKRKYAAFGILGSLAGLLTALFLLTLLLTGISVLSSYVGPMLTCKMHGYNSQCMFNDYDKSGTSIGEWLSDHLPSRFGGGFHDRDW